MQVLTDSSNIITTDSSEAAAFYRAGIRLLVVSSVDAGRVLRAAICADSHLAVGLAALAVDAASRGFDSEASAAVDLAVASVRRATRRERQHVEIVALVLQDPLSRVRALAAEHLREFPDDALVAYLFTSS